MTSVVVVAWFSKLPYVVTFLISYLYRITQAGTIKNDCFKRSFLLICSDSGNLYLF